MRLDPFGMDDAYPLGDGDGDGDHDENPTGERGGPDRLGAVPGSGGAAAGLLSQPEIVTRQNDGRWWSTYRDEVTVWASGAKAAQADANLIQRVPWPYRAGSEAAEVITHATDATGYAAYAGRSDVVSVGPDVETAIEQLVAHVPVPQPTGGSSGDKPPKLEKEPLPPV